MKKNLLKIIRIPDLVLSRFLTSRSPHKNFLLIFVFHGVFLNKNDRFLNLVDPRLFISIEDFCQFLEYSLGKDYTFVSPNDILNGLNNDKNSILITFDDGYFNNKHILSILRKYEIPAYFFISTNHIKYNKSFWWDVLYREGIRHKMSIRQITKIKNQLKLEKSEKCEKYLMDLYGTEAFKPISDIDRPFTPSELKEFSKERLVFLGNHTSNHNILSKYSLEECNSLILSSQRDIYDFTGITPIAISYPDGTYSNEIIKKTKDIGLKLGFTGDFKKYHLPIDYRDNNYMKLGRFNFYGCDNAKECEEFFNIFRSDGILTNWIFRIFF